MQIELKKINKNFGDNHVLKDVSWTAKSGKAFGLLGRNGSGKTTTIRIIMGVFDQDSGEVEFSGLPSGVKQGQANIGYLPEERGLYPKRVIIDQMVYFGELRGMNAKDAKKSAEELLEKLEATEYLNRKLDTLSKGNQQKIQLAIALLTNPDIIILDEPFSGLDPVNASLLKSLVTEMVGLGKLVIFCSHQMASVEEICDDICIIEKGAIVLEGDLKAIKRKYPRNRVLVTPGLLGQVTGFEDAKRRLEASPDIKDIVTGITIEKAGCVVTLKNELDKPKLFNAVYGMGISADTFKVLEPTLEEIFVEKVGASAVLEEEKR